MPYVFHTKVIQSILDPVAQQVGSKSSLFFSLLIADKLEAAHADGNRNTVCVFVVYFK